MRFDLDLSSQADGDWDFSKVPAYRIDKTALAIDKRKIVTDDHKRPSPRLKGLFQAWQ